MSLVTPLLWPPPLQGSLERSRLRSRGDRSHRQYLVLPNAGRPRRLIPLGSSRATATALVRGGGSPRRLPRLAPGLEAPIASGLGRLWLRDRYVIRPDAADASDASSIED